MSLFPKKKKIVMKNYSKEENVKLIKLVEQRGCLWDSKHWEYFKKSSVQKAWADLAEILKDTPRQCQQRWRTIRNMFGKTIHPTQRNKSKQYYLEPYLDFLRPFIRSCCRSKTCCKLKGKGKHKDPQNSNKRLAEKAVSEDSTQIGNELCNVKDDCKDAKIAEVKPKSQTIQQKPTKTKSTELSSDMMFLESLLPFVDEMTKYQTLRFRSKVLNLVDDILG